MQKSERLNNIIDSRCFDDLKKEMGEARFHEIINEKIIPLSGDLIHDGMDLSPEDRLLLTENV